MHDHNHAHDAHIREIPVDFGRAFAIGIAAPWRLRMWFNPP